MGGVPFNQGSKMENILNEIQESQILKNEVDTILQKGIPFSVSYYKKNFGLIQKIGLKRERKFIIYPIYMGTMLRISSLLVDVELQDITEETDDIEILQIGIKAISENADKAARIVALAVTNSEKEPDERLIKFFKHNLTSAEFVKILTKALQQMDIKSFLSFMVSIKKVSLMETVKNIQTIGKSSGGSLNISGSPIEKSSGQ